ncbi:hypothetical protein EV182_008421, partial [Spiromyces aspiralis]
MLNRINYLYLRSQATKPSVPVAENVDSEDSTVNDSDDYDNGAASSASRGSSSADTELDDLLTEGPTPTDEAVKATAAGMHPKAQIQSQTLASKEQELMMRLSK